MTTTVIDWTAPFDPANPWPAELPTAPHPQATNTGHWEWSEEYNGETGEPIRRVAVWINDPIPTAPEKHRKTARDIETQLRTRIGEYDTLVAALDTAGSLTVTQLKSRMVAICQKQGQVLRLQARIDRLVLDALDGRDTETPVP